MPTVRGTQRVVGTGRTFFAASLWLAAGIIVVSAAFSQALAQIVPPSAQPGRERFLFNQPQAPRAQPGGAQVALPGTVAPEGAEKIRLHIRDIRIEGATVYSPDELR